jgi:hypothetical protein
MLLDRVDEDAEMVEERPLRPAWSAGDEVEIGAADLEPRVADAREAELLPGRGRDLQIGRAQRDVVEIELRVGCRLDQLDLEPVAQIDDGLTPGQGRHAQPDPLECPAFARPVGVEDRQLPATCVAAAQEREAVGLLDHPQPEQLDARSRHPLPVGGPECDVVE